MIRNYPSSRINFSKATSYCWFNIDRHFACWSLDIAIRSAICCSRGSLLYFSINTCRFIRL